MIHGARSAGLDIDRLLFRETAIAFVLNATVSALLCRWIFGTGGEVSVRGISAFHLDFVPHTFMTILMGTLIPGLVARTAALRAGAAAHPPIKRVILRFALARALTITPVLLAGVTLCLLPAGSDIPAAAAIAVKFIYGGVLAAAVAPAAIYRGVGIRPGRHLPAVSA